MSNRSTAPRRPAAYTNATSVNYTVMFSEAVTGVNLTDFSLATTGDIGYTLLQALNTSNANIYDVVISGITGNGTLGLNLVDNNTIHDLAGNPLSQSNAVATFSDQATFAADNVPYSVAVDDLNGDGIPDLVVANYGGQDVSVMFGNGDGSFGPQTTYAAGVNPISVAIADVNHDGKPDLVVADQGGQSVSVLLGQSNGTFGASSSYAAGYHPESVSVADVNGDGNPDIVVTNESDNDISVLLGNGNGTFQRR